MTTVTRMGEAREGPITRTFAMTPAHGSFGSLGALTTTYPAPYYIHTTTTSHRYWLLLRKTGL